MGKKYRNLMPLIANSDNLRLAYKKSVRGGNRYTQGHLNFKENLEFNLHTIKQELLNGTYKKGEYYSFKVYEPKERIISALPFKDRVVQHAINNIIEPIFDNTFYKTSYACRKNKGVICGVKKVQSEIRHMQKKGEVFFLKMDFSKYFHSIHSQLLFMKISKKITDKALLRLLMQFINPKGISIGNLLSQLFANIYGHIFDTFIKTKLNIKKYFRYMDDTVILSNSKSELYRYKCLLKKFIGIFMKLKFSKWSISKVEKSSVDFLGYRIRANYKLIRKQSATRAKRKIRYYLKNRLFDKLVKFLASWLGHATKADSFNLISNFKKELIYAKCIIN